MKSDLNIGLILAIIGMFICATGGVLLIFSLILSLLAR